MRAGQGGATGGSHCTKVRQMRVMVLGQEERRENQVHVGSGRTERKFLQGLGKNAMAGELR